MILQVIHLVGRRLANGTRCKNPVNLDYHSCRDTPGGRLTKGPAVFATFVLE